ncbi:TniB family NTP-binding protein [Shewanella sp. PP-He15 brown]
MKTLSPTQIEQLGKFSDCIVMHPQLITIFNDFDELRFNRTFQSDQQCMLLTGDTGVGKSHLINHYKKQVLASQKYGRESIPVLVSRISSGKGLDATLTQMLMDLELFGSHQRKKHGYATDLRKKLVDNLVKAKVELLIINEFQELIEFKTVQERQLIANAFKYISEEARVPIVLVGMPWAEQIAEEPQWSSRLVRRRKLEYFSLQKDSKYYRQYLMGLAKYMPFAEPPKLEDKHVAIPLFAACRGENRILKHLLLEALKNALLADANM